MQFHPENFLPQTHWLAPNCFGMTNHASRDVICKDLKVRLF